MKKKYTVLICAIFVAFCLSACTGINGAGDEDMLGEKSAGVISLLEAADYEAVYAMLRSDVAAELSPEQLEETFSPLLGTLGAREDIKREKYQIKRDKETDEQYYFCQLTVLYADGAATYSIAYDMDYTLIGLSVVAR
jgi:predicted small secreted protein